MDGPRMSFTIALDPDDGVYRPGSVLRGSVLLTSPTSISIGFISVTFAGTSRVKMTWSCGTMTVSNCSDESQAILFHDRRLLCLGGKSTSHESGSYGWDFEIRIPEEVAGLYSRGPRFQFLEAVLNGDPNGKRCRIPPSILYSCGNLICQVEYVLGVRLLMMAGQAGKARTLIASANIDVQSTRGQECFHPLHPPFIRHEQVVKGSKMKAKSWDQLSLSRLFMIPRAQPPCPVKNALDHASSLNLVVLLPTTIEVQDESSSFEILLSARFTRDPSTTGFRHVAPLAAPPKLVMKSMKTTIIQSTHVRAGQQILDSTRKTYKRSTTCSVPIEVSSDPIACSEEETESQSGFNLGNITGLRVAKEFLVVDFASHNIAINHALGLEIGFEYLGKRFEFVWKTVPIKVVAATLDARQIENPGSSTDRLNPADRFGDMSNGASQQEAWLLQPPEETGVLQRETDAFFSQSPPRYMLRIS